MLHDSTLTCSEVSNLLDEYCDGQLNNEVSMQVAKHLESCEKCEADVRATKALIAAFSKMDVLEVTPEFTASLHDRLVQAAAAQPIGDAGKRPLWYLRDWRIYASAVACALIVFVAAYSMNIQYGADSINVATYIDDKEVQDSSASPKVSADTVPGSNAYGEADAAGDEYSATDNSEANAAQDDINETAGSRNDNTAATRYSTPTPTQNAKSIMQSIADSVADDDTISASKPEPTSEGTRPPISQLGAADTSAPEATQSPAEANSVHNANGSTTPTSGHSETPGSDITIIFAPPTTRPTPTPMPTRQPTPTPTKKPTPTPTKQPPPETTPTKEPAPTPEVTDPPVAEPEPTKQASSETAPAPIIVEPDPIDKAPSLPGGSVSPTPEEKADVVLLTVYEDGNTEKTYVIVSKYGDLADYDNGKAVKLTKEMYEEFLVELRTVKGWRIQEMSTHPDSEYVYIKVVRGVWQEQ